MNVTKVAPDLSVVTLMYSDTGGSFDDNNSTLMLAVTAPKYDQTWAWENLKKIGYKKLATGLRNSGYGNVVVWGKKTNLAPKGRSMHQVYFNCCGCFGVMHGSVSVIDTSYDKKHLRIHRVPTTCKSQIPKEFKLIAQTKCARYFAENFVKTFKAL